MRLAGMRPVPRWPARTSVDLHGKRILLTGASSGIGAVAALEFAAQGATIIAVARRLGLLDDVLERETVRMNAKAQGNTMKTVTEERS